MVPNNKVNGKCDETCGNDFEIVENKDVDNMWEGNIAFDDALELTSFGKYNYRLLLLSMYTLLAAIAEVFGVGIIVASSQCDLDLDVYKKGIIGSIPILGVLASAHFWGYLADTRGRLYTLHISIIGTAIFAFLCSFANHWLFLTFSKFASAIFACGTNAVIYTLLGESTLQTHRPRFMLYATTAVMFSHTVICGKARLAHLDEDGNKVKSTNFFQSVWNQTVPLFNKKHLRNTILIFGISVPTYCIGPPFVVWMPFIFNNYKNFGESGMSFCQIFHIQTHSENETTYTELYPVCDDTILPFTFAAITGFSCTITVVSLVCVILIKHIDKKLIYVGIHLIVTALTVAIDYVPIEWGVAAFIGMTCNVVCMGVTTNYAVELFPTYMRAMAVGLSMMFARAISFIFFNIIGVQLLNNCSNFFLYLAVFLFAGALLGLFLPSDRKISSKKEADTASSP